MDDATEGTITTKTSSGNVVKGFDSSEIRGLAVRYVSRKQQDLDSPLTTHEELHVVERWQIAQYQEKSKFLAEGVSLDVRQHQFEIEESMRIYLNTRLSLAKRNSNEWIMERARLGEDLGIALLTKLGLDNPVRHPFDTKGPGPEPNRHLTDVLFRNTRANEQLLFELKWWEDVRTAEKVAARQVLGRKTVEETNMSWGKISGAYIGILNLSLRRNNGELLIRRVW